jgi:hypothetical protein
VGMFDSLYFNCIFCSEENIEQTKSGPCLLDDYKFEENLPIWLMESMNGEEIRCYKCKKKQKLVFDIEIKVNKKIIEPVDNLDYIELEYKKRLKKHKKKY